MSVISSCPFISEISAASHQFPKYRTGAYTSTGPSSAVNSASFLTASNNSTTSLYPPIAAECRGIQPKSSFVLTSTPSPRRCLAISKLPFAQATWKGVCPGIDRPFLTISRSNCWGKSSTPPFSQISKMIVNKGNFTDPCRPRMVTYAFK